MGVCFSEKGSIMKMTFNEIMEKYGWKAKFSLFVYGVICNLPVSFCLSLTSTMISIASINNGSLGFNFELIEWGMFFINYGIAFFIAMLVTLFFPLIQLGKWFTALFGVDNVTFTGNIKYRLLATISYSIVFFLAITPTLNILNSYIFPLIRGREPSTFKNGMISLALNTPFMLIIGYCSSLICDLPAYKVAHKIDPKF